MGWKKLLTVFLGVLTFFGCGYAAYEKKPLRIVSCRTLKVAGYQLFELRIGSETGRVENAKVQIYALCRQGGEESLLSGIKILELITRDKIEQVFCHLTPAQIAKFGRLDKWRVEIWHGSELIAEKNIPRLYEKEKLWWKGQVVERLGFDVTKKDLESIDDDD